MVNRKEHASLRETFAPVSATVTRLPEPSLVDDFTRLFIRETDGFREFILINGNWFRGNIYSLHHIANT